MALHLSSLFYHGIWVNQDQGESQDYVQHVYVLWNTKLFLEPFIYKKANVST